MCRCPREGMCRFSSSCVADFCFHLGCQTCMSTRKHLSCASIFAPLLLFPNRLTLAHRLPLLLPSLHCHKTPANAAPGGHRSSSSCCNVAAQGDVKRATGLSGSAGATLTFCYASACMSVCISLLFCPLL